MRIAVIYGSRSGNTRAVAEAIGRALEGEGEVRIASVDEAGELPPADLLLIGAPTEGHGLYVPMREYLDRLPPGACAGRLAAVFDTRLWWPRLLSGSAADELRVRLGTLGARVIGSESFIVSMKPALKAGELRRAADWVREVAQVAKTDLAAVPG